ncbi:MAG TPA: TlpA disulfide reductase family protein [Pyrinomonadaceae bacterium]|nr:TlpA disulfide reductase family protein [Pyrinomonadaceae bacterium]
MRLTFNKVLSARGALAAALVAALAFAAGCEMDGASKKRPRAAAETPRGQRPPATSRPMPPVEPAHAAGARRGGWTQLDGRRAALEDFRGQVVVLDFYATYCPPCEEEVPHLVKLQREHGPRGLKVIGLNVGGEEDQAKVPGFVKKLGIQYQLANPDEETVDTFLAGNSSIPQTFVFDRQGRMVEHFVGYDLEVAARLEAAIKSALDAKPAGEGE